MAPAQRPQQPQSTPTPREPWPEHVHDASCTSGVCGADVPPLIGSTLTGTGLTLDAAAERLAHGGALPNLTDVQRRLVAEHAEARALR